MSHAAAVPPAAALITVAIAITVNTAATLMDPSEREVTCAGLKVIYH